MRLVRNRFRLLAVLSGLALLIALEPANAGRATTPEIEIRQPGHDPSARWIPAGALAMIFVREEAAGGRLYYTDSRRATPVAVSPSGVAVVGQPQTGPSLEVLPHGTMVAVYSASVPSRHGSEIRAQRSVDGGSSWSAPARVNDDRAAGPHGWLSTAVDSSGGIQVAWLDKRTGEQGLVWTRTTDGVHFEPNRVVDPKVCFCCATSLLAGAGGRSWIAYRDLEGKDLRNIATVSRGPAGNFTPPAAVSDDGWRLDGCPDSGPRLAFAEGGVWAVWFNGAAPGVFSAFAPNGGRFRPRVQIAGASADGAVPNHPEIALLPDGRVVALYVSRSTVIGRVLNPGGKSWSAPLPLVEQAVEPRITVGGGRAALFFTAHSGGDLIAVAETKPLARLAPGSR
jgi:hypothetical protein